jgi:hypothetical protein
MDNNPHSSHAWRRIYCVFCGAWIDVLVDCRQRFCPVCSKRRANRIRNRLQLLFTKNEPIPKAGFKMITLSMPNCNSLDEGIHSLVSSFRRLRQRVAWKQYVFGGAFVIEVKGRPGDWHPHIHAIVYSYYIPWARLRSAWRQCSGGTAVWINKVDTKKAINYITKYITKADVPPALMDDVGRSLARFRLFSRFGSWHNIVLPPVKYQTPCKRCGRMDWIVDIEISRRCKYG